MTDYEKTVVDQIGLLALAFHRSEFDKVEVVGAHEWAVPALRTAAVSALVYALRFERPEITWEHDLYPDKFGLTVYLTYNVKEDDPLVTLWKIAEQKSKEPNMRNKKYVPTLEDTRPAADLFAAACQKFHGLGVCLDWIKERDDLAYSLGMMAAFYYDERPEETVRCWNLSLEILLPKAEK